MDVRRYEAFTIQDAVKLIKKELGHDAIILATREKRKEVPGSPQPVKMVEVVAARSASSKASDSPRLEPDVQPATFPTVHKESDMRIVRGTGTTRTPTMTTLRSELLADGHGASTESRHETARATSVSLNSTPVMTDPPRLPQELTEVREELGRIRRDMLALPHVNVVSEVQELKVLLHDMMRNQGGRTDFARFPEYLTNMAVRLRAAGLLEPLLTDILNSVHELSIPKGPDGVELTGERLKEFHLNSLIRALFKRMGVTGSLKRGDAAQRIACLVGPTGVGKTTTIAKMAADFRLSENARVALVSMDTFRIAGADQLRAYSRILDCPFAEIDEPSELLEFLQKHHSAHYIFIDTAGRSARKQDQFERLKGLKEVAAPIQFHLALASTMKQRDIDETIRAYHPLGLESVIFTKLDESWNYGEIFNAAARSRLPLSYFATGQRVPEDLEIATKERVVERLFQI